MKYCVAVVRYGYLFIEAENYGDALDIADHQFTDTVKWSDDWSPSEIFEDDSQPDNFYIREKAFM